MGLDIAAYRRLSRVENPALDRDGSPVDWQNNWLAHRASIEWAEQHFPGRSEGIEPGAVYRFEKEFRFRAGSYSGYGEWRRGLARLAGYREKAETLEPGPFVELINFADNEGVIGPKVAAKLAKDFQDHQDKADRVANEWWREQYGKWRAAFEMAADGGAVDFR